MEFEEKENMEFKVSGLPKVFIYFLIRDNIVVYVGQTRNGLVRPLSHKNKEFDTIKVVTCLEEELDLLEDRYIDKYTPEYNKRKNSAMNYSLQRVKSKIKEMFEYDINLPEIKKLMKKYDIELHINDDFSTTIKRYDFEKIANHISKKTSNKLSDSRCPF